ncbi:MAG: hypothetical protein IJY71_07105 [Clostridia bacterium]|nr:hypothetical protein [Clostridia bacterium]
MKKTEVLVAAKNGTLEEYRRAEIQKEVKKKYPSIEEEFAAFRQASEKPEKAEEHAAYVAACIKRVDDFIKECGV